MTPFRDDDVLQVFRNIIDEVKSQINCLDNEYILNVSKTELEVYWIDKASIDRLEVFWDSMSIDNQRSKKVDAYNWFDEQKVQVQGTTFDICIPYQGESDIFKLSPSTISLSAYPEINIFKDEIRIPIEYEDDRADGVKIKVEIDGYVKKLSEAINYLNSDIDKHNDSVKKQIPELIQTKLNKAKKSINAVDMIGIPIRRKNIPDTYVIDARRKIKTKRAVSPKTAITKYKPEPVLPMEEYEHILKVMKDMSLVIERNPKAFSTLDEEAIRTHFLLQLNGHYEGGATAETFNNKGKTDILIRQDDRNVFIGECKFWKGKKSFNAAIDQLLGYLAWRDSKCALLIFNKTKNSTEINKKMHKVMIERNEFKKVISHDIHGDSRYIFVKESEPGRDIIITTQIYDI